jgi:transketolase
MGRELSERGRSPQGGVVSAASDDLRSTADSGDVQDTAEVFRGTASGATRLRDERSSDGSDQQRAIPAFVLGEELADLADHDDRIAVLTADLAKANRLNDFAGRHPDRFFNLGIAEKNMITVAAGMAASGMVTYAATFASFSALLGCEQIRTDCAYPHLPVRVIGHHSGMSMGFYGTSHHALEDLGIMRTIADLTVVCATDANHLRGVLRASVDHPGAMYIRLGRGRDPEVYGDVPDVRFGEAIRVVDGGDAAIVATGSTVHPSVAAAQRLRAETGAAVAVYDMHTVKPLDTGAVAAAARTGRVLVAEEHNHTNGLGTAVVEALFDGGHHDVRVRRVDVPDEHVPIGPPAALYAHYGLDADGLLAALRQLLDTYT